MRLVEAVYPDRNYAFVAGDLLYHGEVDLDGAEDALVGHRADLDLRPPLRPGRFRFGVGDRLRVGSELLEAAALDRDAELLQHPLGALLLPPVEALEDAGLEPFAGVVLEHEQAALREIA